MITAGVARHLTSSVSYIGRDKCCTAPLRARTYDRRSACAAGALRGAIVDPQAAALDERGMRAYEADRWDEAAALYRRSAWCSEHAGRPTDAAYMDCKIGEIRSDQGHLEESGKCLERAKQVWCATGEQASAAFVEALLGRLDGRCGRRRQGLELLAGRDDQLALLQRARAVALLKIGRSAEAIVALRDSLRAARERNASYEIAATLNALESLDASPSRGRLERVDILERLQITRLPALGLDAP